MKLYVMCRFAAYERVRKFCDDARDAGHTITHDWTRTDEFGEDGLPLSMDEASLEPAVAWGHARDDIKRGVYHADACVFLADEGQYCGALIEYGAALAYEKKVYLVAPWRASIFWQAPTTIILPDETAVRDLLGMRL